MISCPVCRRSGTMGEVLGPPSVKGGDHLMVRDYTLGKGTTYRRALVVDFVHSGVKLINDGVYTYQFPDGMVAKKSSRDGLFKCCPRCKGEKEVEANERDRFILDEGQTFLVSGSGNIQAAQDVLGVWWAFLLPRLRGIDLLTKEGEVYKPLHFPKVVDDCYQSFTLTHVGTTNVADDTPAYCDTHGWHEGPKCPECT